MPVETAAATAATTTVSATTVALTIASIAATAASAAIAAQSAKAQGKAAAAIGEANAQTFEQEAELKKIAGREEQRKLIEEKRRLLARNRAKSGKSGFVGVPLLLQQEAAKNLALDAAFASFNTQIGIQTSLRAAEISRIGGASAATAGRLTAGAELFRGAAQIAQTGLQLELAKNA